MRSDDSIETPDVKMDTNDPTAQEKQDAQDGTEADGTAGSVDDGTEAASTDRPSDDTTSADDDGVPVRSVEDELSYVREQLLRTAAELQNYRRRTEHVRSAEAAFARMAVVEPLLDILDDLERTLDAATPAEGMADEPPALVSLREGVTLVHKKFVDELERLGVEVIPSVGEPFDELLHDALMQQPATGDVEPGTILREVQKGYRLGDRVLRHAKVIVAA